MSEAARVHGMDGTLVGPDWPALTLAELRDLFAKYPEAGEPVGITFTSPRPLSAAALVRTARGGKFFVKRHARAVRDEAGLQEEHAFIGHLRSRGAKVPRVIANREGRTAIEIGEWTYEVHEAARGADIYADVISWMPFFCARHAYAAGRALAELHRAAEGFVAPRRKPQPLVTSFTIFAADDVSAEMNRYLATHPAIGSHKAVRSCAMQALDLLAPYHAKLRPLLSQLTPQWTHNDWHASNLFWDGAGEEASVTQVVDFGLADRTNAVHDLATAIERNIVGWLDLVQRPDRPDDVPVHLDRMEALLEGYESVRPLSKAEAEALAPMTALCHAEFALSEADYYLGVLHNEENARLAYDGYLAGHAKWFNSRRGQLLLESLRGWAKKDGRLKQETHHS